MSVVNLAVINNPPTLIRLGLLCAPLLTMYITLIRLGLLCAALLTMYITLIRLCLLCAALLTMYYPDKTGLVVCRTVNNALP